MKKCTQCNVEKEDKRFSFLVKGNRRCSWCHECNAVKALAYYYKNREIIQEKQKSYYDKNAERIKQMAKNYVIKNREKVSDTRKKWRTNNKEKVNAAASRKKAARLKATPSWANHFFIEEIYDLAQRRSAILGRPFHVDHIVPLRGKVVCGLHWEKNLQILPGLDNLRKGNLRWPDMPCP